MNTNILAAILEAKAKQIMTQSKIEEVEEIQRVLTVDTGMSEHAITYLEDKLTLLKRFLASDTKLVNDLEALHGGE